MLVTTAGPASSLWAPVNREPTVNSTQRLRLDEFSQLLLGVFLYEWGDRGTNTFEMIRWLHKVSRVLVTPIGYKSDPILKQLTSHKMDSWLGDLFSASETCLRETERVDESPKQMLRLGRRCAEDFLGRSPQEPYFGVSREGRFIPCTKSDDDRIKILREVAAKLPGHPSQIFIRVRQELVAGTTHLYEYATAKPMERASSKRHRDGNPQPCFLHRRWLYCGDEIQGHTDDKAYFRKLIKYFPELVGGSYAEPSALAKMSLIH